MTKTFIYVGSDVTFPDQIQTDEAAGITVIKEDYNGFLDKLTDVPFEEDVRIIFACHGNTYDEDKNVRLRLGQYTSLTYGEIIKSLKVNHSEISEIEIFSCHSGTGIEVTDKSLKKNIDQEEVARLKVLYDRNSTAIKATLEDTSLIISGTKLIKYADQIDATITKRYESIIELRKHNPLATKISTQDKLKFLVDDLFSGRSATLKLVNKDKTLKLSTSLAKLPIEFLSDLGNKTAEEIREEFVKHLKSQVAALVDFFGEGKSEIEKIELLNYLTAPLDDAEQSKKIIADILNSVFLLKIRHGKLDSVSLYIAHQEKLNELGFDINTKVNRSILGDAALEYYRENNRDYLSIVKLLLENGADPNIPNAESFTPLHEAVDNGNVEMAKLLLENGANHNLYSTDGQITPLYIACEINNIELVKLLLTKEDIDVNQPDEDKVSPLLLACYNNNEEIAKLLLERGADPNLADVNGFAPLYYACQNGDYNMVGLLLENGVALNSEASAMALLIACQEGHLNIVDLLLKNNVSASKFEDLPTPLGLACQKGHEEIVELLLDKGADVNELNKGTSPLCTAVANGQFNITKLLLEKGADPNIAHRHGITPLHIVCQRGHYDMIASLLAKGADPNFASDTGITPFQEACFDGDFNIVNLIFDSVLEDKKGFDAEKATKMLEGIKDGGFKETLAKKLEAKIESEKENQNTSANDSQNEVPSSSIKLGSEISTVQQLSSGKPSIRRG